MIDLGSIRWNAVGGDNLPVSTANEINEAKASLLLLNLYYKGEIKRYAGESVFRQPGTDDEFKCDIIIREPPKNMVQNRLSYYQIVNGIPHFWTLYTYENEPTGIGKTYRSTLVPPQLTDSFTLFKLIPQESVNGQRNFIRFSKIEQSLHFFNADTRPYGSYDLKSERFRLSPWRTRAPQDEALSLSEFQDKLDSLLMYGYLDSRDLSLGNCTNMPGLTTYVDFRDEYGTPYMRLSKAYRLLKNRFHKCYVPTTCWYVKHKNRDNGAKSINVGEPLYYNDSFFYVPVGYPTIQPLFNLDLLENAEAVVMCNSPENAEALQEVNDIKKTGIAFTGFICDPGQYDEVDFSPLEGKTVFIEVSNHNGMSMAESCLEAKKLCDYLIDEDSTTPSTKPKFGIKDIRFILREIKYPDMTEVSNLDDLLDTAGGNPPMVDTDSILFDFDKRQFEIILEKAKQEIDRKKQDSQDKPFWGADQKPENKEESKSEEEGDPYASLILRPIINRGMSTIIGGMPYAGKTAFSMAMGGYLRGCDNHFLKNWFWTRYNKELQDEKTEKREKIDYKVVYLLFDSGGDSLLNTYRKTFCPGIERNDPLFITKNCGGNTIDYTQEENYGKFLKTLEEFEEDGRKMDVLFIDTAARFAAQDHFDIKKLNQFMSFFNARRPDVALVFVHHAKDEGELFGGPLALATVRNACVLYRTKEQMKAVKGTPTLNNPFTIRVKKSLSCSNIATDLEDFTARTVKNEFTAVASERQQAKRLRALVDEYEASGLRRPEIASLLDTTIKTLFNHLKAANEVIKDPSQYQDDEESEDDDENEER